MSSQLPILPDEPSVSVGQWLRTSGIDEQHSRKVAITRTLEDLQQRHENEAPIYLRALTAIGAMLSALSVLLLLSILDLFSSGESLLVTGLAFFFAAAMLYRLSEKNEGLPQDFLLQLALTFLQVGKASLIVGTMMLFDSYFGWDNLWLISLVMGLVGISSAIIIPTSLERFLSILAFSVSLWVNLMIEATAGIQAGLYLVLLMLHIMLAAFFIYRPSWQYRLSGLLDGLLVSLCIAVGAVALSREIGGMGMAIATTSTTTVIGAHIILLMALFALILWAAGWVPGKGLPKPLLAALAGLLLLALMSETSLLLALGLLILGYASHHPWRSLLGLAFGAAFLIRYYYLLELDLLQKSIILVVSGLILLAAALLVWWQRWHVEMSGGHNA